MNTAETVGEHTKRLIRELRIAEALITKELAMNDTHKNKSPVVVSQAVYDGIIEIRDSGVTNMLDKAAVQFYADKNGNFELVNWIQDNPMLYAHTLFYGMELEKS